MTHHYTQIWVVLLIGCTAWEICFSLSEALCPDLGSDTSSVYTCQLFLRYKREIFILGVLRFLKTTPSFPKIPKEVRSLPKKSEVFRRRPKSAEGEVIEKTLIHKIRDREEGIVIYSFYTWFLFLTWVWGNIFLEIVSSKTATNHICLLYTSDAADE